MGDSNTTEMVFVIRLEIHNETYTIEIASNSKNRTMVGWSIQKIKFTK